MSLYRCQPPAGCGQTLDMEDAGPPALPCLSCGADVWVRIAEDPDDLDVDA